ncbi:MAG: hypothetical protein WBD40_01850 [Tepidisphaeraceae bacterium]
MILLDENIVVEQATVLRHRRVHFRHVGHDFSRQGIQDDNIIPLLHRLPRPTLFTRDLGLYRPRFCHPNYCIACLDVDELDVADFVRIFLRAPRFATVARRLGWVARVSPGGVRAWQRHQKSEIFIPLP